MIRRDMPEVIAIEKAEFDDSWSEEDFTNQLRQLNCIGWVTQIANRVVGYMIYELHKTSIHIINLAVAEEYRRKGIGSLMVTKLKSKLSHQRHNRIVLEVQEKNLRAQLFFRDLGFSASTVLRDHYVKNDIAADAYKMQYGVPVGDGHPPVNRIARFDE